MRYTLSFLLLVVALQTPIAAQDPWRVAAAPPAGFDRARAQQDARTHLERLVGLNTQNPPGNEVVAARYFDSVLKGVPGIETRVLEFGEGRANFVARLRATRPAKRALLIMGHMDTVGADPAKWTTPPFQATENNGYIYGRGTIDDKGMLASSLAALLQLASRRDSLTRDIVFLGTADEESGGGGIAHLIEHNFDLIKDVEFALNEGGGAVVQGGRVRVINIQVTEKISYNVGAVAKGTSGHGSVPLPDNAIAALSRALARVQEWKAPVRLNEVTREYFRRLATIETNPEMKRAMEVISKAGNDQKQIDAAAEVLSRDPMNSAVMRTGVALTMLNAGIRVNVIPSDATATLNVRPLPDGDIQADIAELNRIGAEKNVTFSLRGEVRKSPPISPLGSDLFKAMEAAGKLMAPDAVAIPFMSTGGTDGAELRARGIPTYGILPMPMLDEDEMRMHGDNERVPIPALGWAVEYLYRVLTIVGEN
jgi:acetylornithine deacetylase/succinyl-diaminopimelate desuccinylase-like protein